MVFAGELGRKMLDGAALQRHLELVVVVMLLVERVGMTVVPVVLVKIG